MELLYEEGEPKQRGVVLLAELVQHLDPIKLAKIVENDQLMGALTRVWREVGETKERLKAKNE